MRLQLAIGFFMVLFLSVNGYGEDMSTVLSSDGEQPSNISNIEDSPVSQDMPTVSIPDAEIPDMEDKSISQDADKSIAKTRVLNKNAAKCYKLANRALKRGLKEMMEAKGSLDNLFVEQDISIIDIRECFKEKDVVSFPEFFDGLYKKYKLTGLREAKAAIIGSGYPELKKAVSSFSEAIKQDPAFVDAFLGRAIAYLEMGMEEEAKIDLEKAMTMGFEKIVVMNVLEEELKNLCLEIADLYLDRINLVDEDQQSNLIKSAEDVLDKFIEVRAATKELILAEDVEEKRIMIMNQYFTDKFIKARCYLSRGLKANAEAEFNKVYEELKSELDVYPTAKEEIDSLGYKIKNMAGLAVVRFEFEEDFKVLKPSVNIELLREDRKPATMDDMNIYLSDSKYEIQFKKDAIRQGISQGKFLISGGHYACNIELSGLEILKKDKIPFAVEETTFYKDIFPAMQLKILSRKGDKLSTITLPQQGYEINPDGTLYDKGKKVCILEEGPCEVYMSISNKLNFMGGKEYVIRIKKAYDWKPYIPIEIARRITKQAVLPGIGVLFLLLR